MANRAFRAVWSSFTLFYAAVILNATLSVQFFTWCAKITDAATLSQSADRFGVGAGCGIAYGSGTLRRGERRTWYATGMLGTSAVLLAATVLIGPG